MDTWLVDHEKERSEQIKKTKPQKASIIQIIHLYFPVAFLVASVHHSITIYRTIRLCNQTIDAGEMTLSGLPRSGPPCHPEKTMEKEKKEKRKKKKTPQLLFVFQLSDRGEFNPLGILGTWSVVATMREDRSLRCISVEPTLDFPRPTEATRRPCDGLTT
jgi:hypothetical protein